jgi:hypothetical protein
MAEEDQANQIRAIIKEWVVLDDEERNLKQQIKTIREKKTRNSDSILKFMRDNSVDNFALEGSGVGNISRSVRTSRPPLRRETIRTQLLIQFADQPQRVAEALRQIEGIAEGDDMTSATGTVREVLSRRIPKQKNSMTI